MKIVKQHVVIYITNKHIYRGNKHNVSGLTFAQPSDWPPLDGAVH